MNIFRKVTLESLKKNKTRTIVTIIGIILSASMFMAVTTTMSSVHNYFYENAIYTDGDWHVSAQGIDKTVFDFLKNPSKYAFDEESEKVLSKSEVESYVYNQVIGYAVADGCINEYKPYLHIIGADKSFCETMPVHLTGGRLPENSTEIILPEHLESNGGVRYKVGDVITLEIGKRITEDGMTEEIENGESAIGSAEENPYILGQNNPFQHPEDGVSETLVTEETRIYTVVGFYERPSFEPYSAPGYTAITTMDKVHPSDGLYNVYFKLETPAMAMQCFFYMPYGSTYNGDVLSYLGVFEIAGYYTVVGGLAAIVCGLIMFGSISLIYNAFSISVSERTKQFGLLSSLGATKRQLRQMVFFEAGFVSVIGIPLGILAGVGGMAVTFHFIAKQFNMILDLPIPFRLYVNPWAVIIASIITLVTVFISAWIPSRRATTVTAVEAIRQSKDVKLSRKDKTNRKEGFFTQFLYRVFGLPGMIADKYYNRSKKKYRATIISLFMSIVLFISASALTSYLTNSVSNTMGGADYDLYCTYTPEHYLEFPESETEVNSEMGEDMAEEYPEDTLTVEQIKALMVEQGLISEEKLAQSLKELESVEDVGYYSRFNFYADIPKSLMLEEYLEYRGDNSESEEEEINGETLQDHLIFYFLGDKEFSDFLKENHLDEEKYMNTKQPVAIALDTNIVFDNVNQKYIDNRMLKEKSFVLHVDNEVFQGDLQIGTTLYEKPWYMDDTFGLTLIYPESARATILENCQENHYSCSYMIKASDYEKAEKEIKNALTEVGLGGSHVYNYAKEKEEIRGIITVINVLAYGFIVLISLIAAANVFNTISTNIALRRREFAMLKSVGMSDKEMNRMMNFECILYGSRALITGIPVSLGITVLIFLSISGGLALRYYIPWDALLIATLSVFIVVFATMIYAMRKIKADNPIDALKNENL